MNSAPPFHMRLLGWIPRSLCNVEEYLKRMHGSFFGNPSRSEGFHFLRMTVVESKLIAVYYASGGNG
jgi:hypothetical protein